MKQMIFSKLLNDSEMQFFDIFILNTNFDRDMWINSEEFTLASEKGVILRMYYANAMEIEAGHLIVADITGHKDEPAIDQKTLKNLVLFDAKMSQKTKYATNARGSKFINWSDSKIENLDGFIALKSTFNSIDPLVGERITVSYRLKLGRQKFIIQFSYNKYQDVIYSGFLSAMENIKIIKSMINHSLIDTIFRKKFHFI